MKSLRAIVVLVVITGLALATGGAVFAQGPELAEIEGVIKAVNTQTGTITITPEKGKAVVLTVTEDTEIYKDGDTASIEDLAKDDEVEALDRASALPAGADCPKCGKGLVSAAFGGSDVLVDVCPACKGVWLDYDELRGMQEYLRDKLVEMTPDEMRHKVYEEIKEIWDGPEDVLSEVLDAKAAVAALVNLSIIEHPKLARLLNLFGRAAGSIGM